VCKWQFQPGQAIYNGTVIQVNGISWNLLKAFVESDKALTETELIDAGWGHDSDKETKTLQNALSTLRFRLRKSLSLADDQDPIPSVDSGANRAWALADCLR
jgi:DNA-binding response OmpR family regulator